MGVQKLVRPDQSLDVNHVEHMWDELKCRPKCPQSVTGLTCILWQEWSAIFAATVEKLEDSFLHKMTAIIKAICEPKSR
ncbi:hypothetical protein TNIN_283661 [Trichonephila inaurata madagascariensis]|uniref:Uncharacterized protein n=1 Tax=Trichonephila inaurata madagascariensis TaxID=2747483 RepID=A0A8X6YUD8_9ARAC|nr:hypothetical protein TNIN_283661 [Trichonephila inaurata madagascariensis]